MNSHRLKDPESGVLEFYRMKKGTVNTNSTVEKKHIYHRRGIKKSIFVTEKKHINFVTKNRSVIQKIRFQPYDAQYENYSGTLYP